MKRRLILGLMSLWLAGCSAVSLNEENLQATTQLEAAVEATVAHQLTEIARDVPRLIYPQSGANISEDNVILDWEYSRTLNENERFQVRVAVKNSVLQPIIVSTESFYDVTEWLRANPSDIYSWAVEIVIVNANGNVLQSSSDLSAIDSFSVEGIQSENIPATFTALADTRATIIAGTLEAMLTPTIEPESTAEPESTLEAESSAEPESTVEPESTPDSESTAEVSPDFVPTSAEVRVFGEIPSDSDRLDTITSLSFDEDGRLLVGLRSGKIYALEDTDGDGRAEPASLIFDDSGENLSQVIGIFAQNEVLYSINGRQLSRIQDSDGDGLYDTVSILTAELPDNLALSQASNAIVQSSEGRYFTANTLTGEILEILLVE